MKITTKAEMYRLLASGVLGDTSPQYFSLTEWERSPDYAKYEYWGVRHATISGHPACRMNVHRLDVATIAIPIGKPNISPMIDRVTGIKAYIEVTQGTDAGFHMTYVDRPRVPEENWRSTMKNPARVRYLENSAARAALRHYLLPASVEWIDHLLTTYPGAVVEMSSMDTQLFRQGNNHCIWEVRHY